MEQEGIYFHNTFALVINWSTVRLIIIIIEVARWESIKIDYVLNFSQGTIHSDVYLHLSAVFHVYGRD